MIRAFQTRLRVLELPRLEHFSPCVREFFYEAHEPTNPRRHPYSPHDFQPRPRVGVGASRPATGAAPRCAGPVCRRFVTSLSTSVTIASSTPVIHSSTCRPLQPEEPTPALLPPTMFHAVPRDYTQEKRRKRISLLPVMITCRAGQLIMTPSPAATAHVFQARFYFHSLAYGSSLTGVHRGVRVWGAMRYKPVLM